MYVVLAAAMTQLLIMMNSNCLDLSDFWMFVFIRLLVRFVEENLLSLVGTSACASM